jgi:C4-dicarboxylate-specific signal transduction histidine kinase
MTDTLSALMETGDAVYDLETLRAAHNELRAQVEEMTAQQRKSADMRRAMLHIICDMNEANKRLADQRKAMLHILSDYEHDRRRLALQTERLNNTRRAILHILQDFHQSNLRLESGRKAMIHIMGDLRDTTVEVQSREQQLRDKQEQLVQAGKLATLGELTTGVAHELNNPLNNIGLFLGNVIDLIQLGAPDKEAIERDLRRAMDQVNKAAQIISHLRTFGRAAPVSREPVWVNGVIESAISLMQEQLHLRNITVQLDLSAVNPIVIGNAIQLEQVMLNLLTNARDVLIDAPRKLICVRSEIEDGMVKVTVEDSGPGIPRDIEQRVFDPFFTTKDVGSGTGLGLSITYGIIQDHQGTIRIDNRPGSGVAFIIRLPLEGVKDATKAAL